MEFVETLSIFIFDNLTINLKSIILCIEKRDTVKPSNTFLPLFKTTGHFNMLPFNLFSKN